VSLGFKTVRVDNPDPEVDDDDRQVRPCMVVLVTNDDPELCNSELTPLIVQNVLAAIRQKHTSQYIAEEGSPHWLRFILYKPEYEAVEHLGGGGDNSEDEGGVGGDGGEGGGRGNSKDEGGAIIGLIIT